MTWLPRFFILAFLSFYHNDGDIASRTHEGIKNMIRDEYESNRN